MRSHPLGRSLCLSPDSWAIVILLALGFPLYWDRVRHGRHLSRVDIVNQFLPNYAYLGDRIRSGDLPGWNPYVSSGMPFLGDALSGWGYLPAMITYTILPAEIALKANFLIQIWIATLAMYGLARIVGLNWWGAMTAAVTIEFGSIVAQFRSVTAHAQLSTWVPLALLGIELSLRASSLRGRALGWAAGAIALSQMIVGWPGQGSIYGLLIVVGYVSLRSVWSLFALRAQVVAHFVRHITDGVAILAFGLALSAAGLWIRLEVNRESLIAGGSYGRVFGAQRQVKYMTDGYLVSRLLLPSRYFYLGGATLGLAILAPFVVRRHLWRVGFYLSLCAALIILFSDRTGQVREWVFTIPRFQDLHEHNISRGLILFATPAALLAGSTVDAITRWNRSWNVLLGLSFVPILFAKGLGDWLAARSYDLSHNTRYALMAVGVCIAIYALALALLKYLSHPVNVVAKSILVTALVVFIVRDPFWATFNRPLRGRAAAMPPEEVLSVYLSKDDPGGPGGFLQSHMETEGPFRFLGYGPGIITTKGPRAATTYHGMFRDPLVVELLFSRAMRLSLENIQGYNPVQSARYGEFLAAVNGEPQNYHDANILRTGFQSPLLRILNVRYIIVGKNDDSQFPELKQLEDQYPVVFEDATVKIIDIEDALPHAWIVHSAEAVSRDQALGAIQRPDFSPEDQAVVEGTQPTLEASIDPEAETVQVVHFEPDRVELTATLSAPGLVVISEMYAGGWKAYVDGKPAKIYPTDYVLRGIALPAGTHSIEMRYAPASIYRGIAISLTAFVVLALLIVQPWRYKKTLLVRLNEWETRVRDSVGTSAKPV
jgi:Bacterial membrane protein YfhO